MIALSSVMTSLPALGLDNAWILQSLSPWGRAGKAPDFAGLFAEKIGASRPGKLAGVAQALRVGTDKLQAALDSAGHQLGVSGQALQDAFWAVRDVPGTGEADAALQAARKAVEGGRLRQSALDLFDLRRTLEFSNPLYGSRREERPGEARSSFMDFFGSGNAGL